MGRERADAVVVQGVLAIKPLTDMAIKYRMPTASTTRVFAEIGGLMSFGADGPPLFGTAPSLFREFCRAGKRKTCLLSNPRSSSWSSISRLRRNLAAGAAVLPTVSRIASAQTYPSRPVKIIVGQAAGSASDIIARLIAQFLSEKLGQQFLVEVRPGAAGNIATEAVTRMPPDGYTLLLVNSQNAINVALYEKLSFDFVRDIAPVGRVQSVPLVMEVHPSVPAKTVSEFIAYAKANPGKLNMASAGIGGPEHIAGELFKFMAGVDLTHIPTRARRQR
jgi:hypothetical protein